MCGAWKWKSVGVTLLTPQAAARVRQLVAARTTRNTSIEFIDTNKLQNT